MNKRCPWVNLQSPEYVQYHDDEWGVPVYDDGTLFEFLILEGAQAGLSWLTILKRREGYREVFDDFDVQRVARFTQRKIEAILKNPKIIRNRLKVESAVSNAKAFLKVQEEFGSFFKYQWQFVGEKPIQNSWKTLKQIPAKTKISDAFSQDLKKRGFRFVGSTIIYAHMQAVGMVNDHTVDCFRYKKVKKMGQFPR
jgi:DNA-3-methyladenine glycosylase I